VKGINRKLGVMAAWRSWRQHQAKTYQAAAAAWRNGKRKA